jgi:two-component system, NtrC family, sensor histidine kinase HydH
MGVKMSFRRRWLDGAAVAVAIVAALALAITVGVARAELEGASLELVRGEGETLSARIHEQLARQDGPPTRSLLEGRLAALQPEGLRFLAIEMPEGLLGVGESQIDHAGLAAGTIVVQRGRALLVSPLPRRSPRPNLPARTPEISGFDFRPPREGPPLPPRLLLLEFEPSILARVSTGMSRTVAVATIAVVVLLGFAGVLALRVVGRAATERKAERDRKLAALGQMAGVMAHELRNPLTSLKGNAQLLAEMLDEGSRQKEKATLVVAEAVRIERLTHDLLAFVRDGGVFFRAVSPATLLDRALRDFPRSRVVYDLVGAPATIWVDEARLSAALGNLVQNAIQATEGDELVQIRVAAADGALVIEVHDTGPGIVAGDEERIFEPFFTTRLQGTGLGLAVARRAVEEQGGTLRAGASPGGGSVFRIHLPAKLIRPQAEAP